MAAVQLPSELLSDRAYAALRDRLVALDIPPGAPIDEEALTGELGVGRTPVREAIAGSRWRGWSSSTRAAARSRPPSTSPACPTSPTCACSSRRARPSGPPSWPTTTTAREAAELIATLEAAEPSQRSLIELDARVHRFVSRCCRNPYLAQDLDRYLNMSLRIWRLTWDRLPPLQDRVREHCELLDAIRTGQPERARAVAQAHVRAFAEEMRAAL